MHELDDDKLLKQVLESVESQLNTAGIRKVGSGNEFYIFGANLDSGRAVIKIPKDRIFSNVNDAYIDSRALLDQEFALMRYAKKQGIAQVPEPIDDLEAAGFGALVMSYVPSDDSKPDEFELGKLLARIHSIEPPTIQLSAQEKMGIPELITTRLLRRWGELGSVVIDLPALPQADVLTSNLDPIRHPKRLLHMDFRQANLRTKEVKSWLF